MSKIILSCSSVIGMSFHQCTSGLVTFSFFFFKSNKSNLAHLLYLLGKSISTGLWETSFLFGFKRETKRVIQSRKMWWWCSHLPTGDVPRSREQVSSTQGIRYQNENPNPLAIPRGIPWVSQGRSLPLGPDSNFPFLKSSMIPWMI